jgi:hypothetical protein
MSIRMRINVLFPAPFGPSRPKISPPLTSNDTPRNATVCPYAFSIPSKMTTGVDIARGLYVLAVRGPRAAGRGSDVADSITLHLRELKG